ncbi:MAG TPA: putative baseplate assembly protein [Trebonia sp.]|nr:putative baseplate assembly protein [Trebonia sp.]
MDAPLVDARTSDVLAARTATLATGYSQWSPPAPGATDPGSALIGVFARFAGLVTDHLNQAPLRNFVSFLNLIGTQPQPPRPAVVPLTFSLASGASAGALVPAGTPVATADDTRFETDADLTVSPANLVAVFVGDPEDDQFSDRTSPSGPFAAFTGDQPVPHDLLIGVTPTTAAGPLTVLLTTPDAPFWDAPPVTWAAWDGASWVPVTATLARGGGDLAVALAAVPPLPALALGGVSAGWVRASLAHGLPVGPEGLAPESVAVGTRNPQDMAAGLAPFGDASATVKWFYLSADDTLAPGGALAHLRVTLDTPAQGAGVQLNWTYKLGSTWVPLGVSTTGAASASGSPAGFSDGTLGLTQDGSVDFSTPADWPVSLYRTRLGRWLRLEVAAGGGSYTTLPVIDAITVTYEWDLPQVAAVALAGDPAPAPAAVTAAALNGAPVDATRPFWPFGPQPAYGDTLEIAVPPGLAAPLTLDLTLVNPQGAAGPLPVPAVAAAPAIAWDSFDGTAWTPMTAANGGFFSAGGQQALAPAAGAGTITKVRARLDEADPYGKPASYVADAATGGYTYVASSFAPPVAAALAWVPGPGPQAPPLAVMTHDDQGYVARTGSFPMFEPGQEVNPALYLGFDRPPGASPVALYIAVADPDPAEVSADQLAGLDPATAAILSWQYLSPAGWSPLPALDATATLSGSGAVAFLPPADLSAGTRFGVTATWIRLCWDSGYFPVAPQLAAVLANTVTATQAMTITGEVLGSGNGSPGQALATAQAPVLPGAVLEVRAADGTWAAWQAVTDFYDAGPADQCYTLDPLTGTVTFGDGAAGAMPPVAPSNVRISYRTGGGPGGNQPPGAASTLKAALASVDSVTNYLPAQGGAVAEPLDAVLARGPLVLRHRERAVTAQDLEDLAREASTDVARVKAIVPAEYDPLALWMDPASPVLLPGHTSSDAGSCGVIIVPDSAAACPAPGYGLIAQVRQYLGDRCGPTVAPWVAGPEWISAAVSVTVIPASIETADQVREAVLTALAAFLHPLTGGLDGTGWAFGRKPHASEVYAVIERVPGVDHVGPLALTLTPASPDLADRISQVLDETIAHAADPVASDVAQWLSRALVHSGDHAVTMSLEG